MLKLLSVGQEIQENGGYVSCQSSCVSQLIQVSAVFVFMFEFLFACLLSYFSGLIKFLTRVSICCEFGVFPDEVEWCLDCIIWR